MANVMEVISWLLVNWSLLLNAVLTVLAALIALFLLIPGPAPENWFKAIANFLEKFSKK